MSRTVKHALVVNTLLALVGAPAVASAESLIKQPGVHPVYKVELEPHFLLQLVEPPGLGTGAGPGIGPGFRMAVELLDNGPIQSINNTMALGFGVDFAHFSRGGRCSTIECGGAVDHFYFPLVLQWNFWLSDDWSVFGEPGIAYRWSPDTEDRLDTFIIAGGARYHFSNRVALTLRAGYPALSVGLSILL